MNGKQAKRLRRIAMGMAVAFEQNGKTISERDQKVVKHTVSNSSSIMSNQIKNHAYDSEIVVAETVENSEMSYRNIYQTLKRGVVDGKIKG